MRQKGLFGKAAGLYIDGFRNMTWGKPLWILIILKLIILFGVLRLFFFKPELADMTDSQKIEAVGENLTSNSITKTNKNL